MAEDEAAAVEPFFPPTGSVTKGVIAGLAACLLSIPLGAVGFPVALILRRTMLSEALGREVSRYGESHGSTAWLADVLVALAAGAISAAVATLLVLLVVKDVRQKAFFMVASAGYAAIAVAIWLWLRQRHPEYFLAGGFNLFLAWAGASLGAMVAAATPAEEDKEKAAAPAAD